MGFLDASEHVFADVAAAVAAHGAFDAAAPKQVVFCGHSLGGAKATLHAASLLGRMADAQPADAPANGANQVVVVTQGAPPIFHTAAGAVAFDAFLGAANNVRFVMEDPSDGSWDLITLPSGQMRIPAIQRWSHSGHRACLQSPRSWAANKMLHRPQVYRELMAAHRGGDALRFEPTSYGGAAAGFVNECRQPHAVPVNTSSAEDR
jgi:acetyl esterase/lipase